MTDDELIRWMLAGDVSIQHQVHRDLLGQPRPDLAARIATEGWGARFLAARRPDGHWGRKYYQPKWTSTHYTLQDLRNLELPAVPAVLESVNLVLDTRIADDGGVNPAETIPESDVCVNGMALDFAGWFGASEGRLRSVIDFVLSQRLPDGGFNCRLNRGGASHSSVHSTLCVLEGLQTLRERGPHYRAAERDVAAQAAREFLLVHRLFRSHRTGEVISPSFLRLSYPGRWRFDVLRALDHFRRAEHADPRLDDALEVVRSKRRRDGRWTVQAKHPGATHFDMEQAGKPSRWNTLRALRVLRWSESRTAVPPGVAISPGRSPAPGSPAPGT